MKTSLIAAILMIAAGSGFAVINFNDGQIHNIDTAINDDVTVDFGTPGVQTTLNLLPGGSIGTQGSHRTLTIYNDGIANISFNAAVFGALIARDYSTVEIAGTVTDDILAENNSEVNLNFFSTPGVLINISDNSRVTMSNVTLNSQDGTTVIISSSRPVTIFGSDFAINGTPVAAQTITPEFLAAFTGPTILTCCEGAINIPITLAGNSSIELTAAPISEPEIRPNGGTSTKPQRVSLSSSTPLADIFYTTDGSEPTRNSNFYNGTPFTLNRSTVVKAKVFTQDAESQTATAVFKIGPVISGFVKTSGGTPRADVTITATNGGGKTMTNTGGYYAVRVPYNWTGEVRPSKSGYTFSPTRKVYSSLKATVTRNQNFTIFTNPTISGYVRGRSGTPISGVTVSADNNGDVTMTNTSGHYTLHVPRGWTGTVRLQKKNYSWSPSKRTYRDLIQSETSQNFTALGWPRVSGFVKTSGGTPISGVTLTTSSGATARTDASGYYAFRVPFNWTSRIKPSKTGWFFEPSSRPYTDLKSSKNDQNYVGRHTP